MLTKVSPLFSRLRFPILQRSHDITLPWRKYQKTDPTGIQAAVAHRRISEFKARLAYGLWSKF